MPLNIDINCDLGEGMGNDALIMPYITSANIACGYHAGDMLTMEKTVELALRNNVHLGAHPSYPDKENFGRKVMNLSEGKIYDVVLKQMETLANIAEKQSAVLNHMKLHGALYNQTAFDTKLGEVVCKAVLDFNPNLIIYGLSGSPFLDKASEMGLKVAHEVFADRTYQEDGSLTPRNHPNALIENADKMLAQVKQMVENHSVTSTSGKVMPIKADTICIHGDGKNAVLFAQKIKALIS